MEKSAYGKDSILFVAPQHRQNKPAEMDKGTG